MFCVRKGYFLLIPIANNKALKTNTLIYRTSHKINTFFTLSFIPQIFLTLFDINQIIVQFFYQHSI